MAEDNYVNINEVARAMRTDGTISESINSVEEWHTDRYDAEDFLIAHPEATEAIKAKVAATDPDYPAREVLSKIGNIERYGWDYRRCGEQALAIIRTFDVDWNAVIAKATQYAATGGQPVESTQKIINDLISRR